MELGLLPEMQQEADFLTCRTEIVQKLPAIGVSQLACRFDFYNDPTTDENISAICPDNPAFEENLKW